MVQVQFLTAAVGALCVTLFVVPGLLGKGAEVQHTLCFSPNRVVSHFELYRISTSPFIHAGFFHILLNMIAWYFLSNQYESRVGSLSSFYNVFVLLLPLCALFHLGVSYALDFVFSWHTTYECAVGISGLLFALLVISLEFTESVSIFGFFDMPAKWYPLALALILQLLSSGLSFLGHLSGIAVGYAFVSDMFSFAKLSNTTLASIENKLSLRSLPYWTPSSDSGFYLWGTGYGNARPAQGSSDESFSASLAAVRDRVSGWFSSDSSESQPSQSQPAHSAAFSGTGHVVGGQRPARNSNRTGVPPQSRLLALARRRSRR